MAAAKFDTETLAQTVAIAAAFGESVYANPFVLMVRDEKQIRQQRREEIAANIEAFAKSRRNGRGH